MISAGRAELIAPPLLSGPRQSLPQRTAVLPVRRPSPVKLPPPRDLLGASVHDRFLAHLGRPRLGHPARSPALARHLVCCRLRVVRLIGREGAKAAELGAHGAFGAAQLLADGCVPESALVEEFALRSFGDRMVSAVLRSQRMVSSPPFIGLGTTSHHPRSSLNLKPPFIA